MLLLRTFWRLWIKSSAWWAKENECSDSQGKRDKSSESWSGEELAAGGSVPVGWRVGGRDTAMEAERELAALEGLVVGCCRMRRRPEAPKPCSCSGMMGDLKQACQRSAAYKKGKKGKWEKNWGRANSAV